MNLHDVLASHGDPVPVRMGVPVRWFRQQADTVTVEFGDATAADRYDLVIGADGIYSTVRELLAGAGAVRPVGRIAWRFVTECPPEVTTWTVLLGRNVTFLAMPIGRGQVYCYCDAPTEGAAMALEDGLILAECLGSGGDIAQAVARFQARRRPRTQWVLAQTHRRDRTRNLPPALRNLVLRRWGPKIFRANYGPLLDTR